MSKTKGVFWFTCLDIPVGIVLTEDEITKEKKAYIGLGNGFDEESDKEHIKKHGSKLDHITAQEIAEFLKPE